MQHVDEEALRQFVTDRVVGAAKAQDLAVGEVLATQLSPPFDAETLTPGETTQLEATLRRLARGEPCGDIARAAAEAADGVAEMLARAPR